MQRLPRNRCLATGYSCRSQVNGLKARGYAILCRLYWRLLMIWKRKITLEALNAMGEGNMWGSWIFALNILVMTPLKRQCSRLADKAAFRVAAWRSIRGMAESIGSVAGYLCTEGEQKVLVWKSMLTTSARHEKGGCAGMQTVASRFASPGLAD